MTRPTGGGAAGGGAADGSAADSGAAGRVELVRSGGVAGRRLRRVADAADLTPAERAGLDALLGRPASGAPTAGPPDRFVYELAVVWAHGEHRVRLGEADLDERLRALVRRLEAAGPTSA